jgi:hypothetical protein
MRVTSLGLDGAVVPTFGAITASLAPPPPYHASGHACAAKRSVNSACAPGVNTADRRQGASTARHSRPHVWARTYLYIK